MRAMQRFDLKSLRSAATARTYPIGAEELRDAIKRVVGELPGSGTPDRGSDNHAGDYEAEEDEQQGRVCGACSSR